MILGINISHNSSACLVAPSGEVIFAAAEERFSRRKNDTGFPALVLNHIFEQVAPRSAVRSVAVGDLCLAVHHGSSFAQAVYLDNLSAHDQLLRDPLRLVSILGAELARRALHPPRAHFRELLRARLTEELPGSTIRFYDHHLCHAASAYYCSPFDNALIVTLDGTGDDSAGLVSLGQAHELKTLHRLPATASVGTFYKSIVSLLDFMPGAHEGKISGLAAFGNPDRYYGKFSGLLSAVRLPDGDLTISSKCAESAAAGYDFYNISPMRLALHHAKDYLAARQAGWSEFRRRALKRFFRAFYEHHLQTSLKGPLPFQTKADLAAACQAVLEDVVVRYVRHYLRKYGCENIALAGGVFSNVKLNQRILAESGARRIYIHPAMGDEGLAVGAAKYQAHKAAQSKPQLLDTAYLGAGYPEHETALRDCAVDHVRLDQDELSRKAGQALASGRIVGLFTSRAEYGPRALGHRSILAPATDARVNDILNRRFGRNDFMPFAPAVLTECFEDVFEAANIDGARVAARFMTITLNVKERWRNRIPAVVHLDGTARPQIVAPENPLYYGIIKEYQRQTGLGVVINTSFNMHDEPIVNAPADALRMLASGAIDALILEDRWCAPPPGPRPGLEFRGLPG